MNICNAHVARREDNFQNCEDEQETSKLETWSLPQPIALRLHPGLSARQLTARHASRLGVGPQRGVRITSPQGVSRPASSHRCRCGVRTSRLQTKLGRYHRTWPFHCFQVAALSLTLVFRVWISCSFGHIVLLSPSIMRMGKDCGLAFAYIIQRASRQRSEWELYGKPLTNFSCSP